MRLRGGSGEEANISVEYAMVTLLFVLGAAMYQSVQPDQAPSINAGARQPVEQLADDLLRGLTDVGVPAYGDQLSRIIARGVIDDTATLDRVVRQAMPPGTECRLLIDNGEGGRRQMGGDEGRLADETIGRARYWRPGWSYTFTLPSLEVITPLQPMDVQGFTVTRGALLKESGVPLQVTLRTDQGNYTKATLTSFRPGPVASLLLRDGAGNPGLSHIDLGSTTDWTIVLREEGAGTLPAGTSVTVRFPYKFTGLAQTNTTQDGWRNITITEDPDLGRFVTAELATPLGNAARDLVIHAVKPDPAEPLYLVQAHLSNGTEGAASFVLAKIGGVPLTTNPIQRSLYLDVPKPIAPGSTSTWGLLFTYPALTGTGTAEHVTRIDLQSTDGSAVYQNVTGPGWTMLSPSHAQWTGDRGIGANRFLALTFQVQAADQVTEWEPGLRLPVDFTTQDHFELADRAQPYVYAASIPPAELTTERTWGYVQPALSGVPPQGQAAYNVTWVNRGLRTDGTANYTVSTFAPLTALLEATRTGLARSQVNLTRHEVRIGEVFNLSVDFRGLLDQITVVQNVTITAWNVEVKLFDPSQPLQPYEAMVPSFQGRFGANGSLDFLVIPSQIQDPTASNFSAPLPVDVTSIASATIPFMPPRKAFYGPHAIVAQANFVVNDMVGNSMVQSARLLAVVNVLPESGWDGPALYWASVECWLPDW